MEGGVAQVALERNEQETKEKGLVSVHALAGDQSPQ